MLRWRPITTAEFPHSDTHGSMLAYSSPWLFAVNRVLHRLLMPRHSPYALISLIFSRIGSNNLSRLHEFSFSLHPLKLQQSDITTLLLSFDLMFFSFSANLLLYAVFKVLWWAQVDSNHRPHAYQACALTSWAMSPCQMSRQYTSLLKKWWRWTGSNRWPPACKAGALPAELYPHIYYILKGS